MPTPGASRQQIAETLNTAYADGLLSKETLSHRLDLLFGKRLIDPTRLIGDLSWRTSGPLPGARLVRRTVMRLRAMIGLGGSDPMLLGLDWNGAQEQLDIGRDPSCDVRLRSPLASRQHARLIFRDGCWIVQDLGSMNGTAVNGKAIGRCRLAPGDDLAFADEHVRVD